MKSGNMQYRVLLTAIQIPYSLGCGLHTNNPRKTEKAWEAWLLHTMSGGNIKWYLVLGIAYTFSLSSVPLPFEPVHVVYLKSENATAIKLKWNGNPHFPTEVQYQSTFNETGALVTQNIILIPRNVTSFEMNIDNSVPGYLFSSICRVNCRDSYHYYLLYIW